MKNRNSRKLLGGLFPYYQQVNAVSTARLLTNCRCSVYLIVMKHSSYTPKWNGPCQSSTQHKEAGSASTHPENLETRKSFVCPTTDFYFKHPKCFMSLHWCWILKPMQQSTKTTASVLQPYPLRTLLLDCQVLFGTMLGMCSLPAPALLSTLVMLSTERTCSKRKASKYPSTCHAPPQPWGKGEKPGTGPEQTKLVQK